MNIMRNLFLVGAVLCTNFVWSQSFCGNEGEDDLGIGIGRSESSFAIDCMDNPPDGDIIRCVPIQVWVFRHEDGTGGITEAEADNMVAGINANFLESNMRFLPIAETEFVDDDDLFGYNYELDDCPQTFNTFEDDILPVHWTDDVLNIYVVEDFKRNGSGLCGYASTPANPLEYVFVRPHDCYEPEHLHNNATHEIGHYFGLRHTHHWASSACYTVDKELVNGSNCTVAGDFLCDTPACPNLFSSDYDAGTCTYTDDKVDTNGDPYAPLPTNYMSYAPFGCLDSFTPDQIRLMQCTYDQVRKFVSCESNNCLKIISDYPYVQNFESWELCSTNIGAGCVLDASTGWENVTADDMDWRVNQGTTPSTGTGPSVDATLGNSYGNYLYVEASGFNVGYPEKKAIVTTPCFYLPTIEGFIPQVAFKIHAVGANHREGFFHFEIFDGEEWTTLAVFNGLKSLVWFNKWTKLTDYEGQLVKFRFRAVTGASFKSDFAIDDFKIVYLANMKISEPLSYTTEQTIQNDFDNVKVYPNPTDGELNLSLGKVYENSLSIDVIDLSGKVILQTKEVTDEAGNIALNLNNLSKGLYFLRVAIEDEVVVKQFSIK